MYKKTKHKRRRIQIRYFFEAQILPYILTGLILFTCFLITAMLGVKFGSIGNMVLWVLGVGFIFGSLLLDYFKTNIKSIIKSSFKVFDSLERKLHKKNKTGLYLFGQSF